MAQAVAPPEPPEFIRIGCGGILICIVLSLAAFFGSAIVMLALGGNQNMEGNYAAGAVLFTVAAYFTLRYRRAKRRYDDALNDWDLMWICLRCGHIWMPEG